MAINQLRTVLRHIRGMIGAQCSEGVTDAQLLERFVCQRDEAAFEVLVWRHGPMVLGLCQRLLQDTHAAEDALQATFLTLVRKGGSIAKRASVSSWLYKVAYRIALRAKASAAERAALERKLGGMASAGSSAEPEHEAARRELREILDDELNRLPEKYRVPILLCHFEGKTFAEAAQELGWAKGTVSTRMSRARELLRTRLIRRGLALSAAAMVTVLAQSSAPAVPTSLVTATIKAAMLLATGQGATASIISAEVSALIREALQAMFMIKLKMAAVVLLAVGGIAAGAGLLARQVLTEKPAQARKQDESASVASAPIRTETQATNQSRIDRYGDPLPQAVLARLGTVRWRHGDQVTAVAFSTDGNTIASGSYDGAIHLWNRKTGRLFRILQGAEACVSTVFFTLDGKQLISCGSDLTARVWDVATGKELRRWKTPGGGIPALSPDRKLLACPGAPPPRSTIVLWDVGTGNKVCDLPFEDIHGGAGKLAFSPDGTRLITGGVSTLHIFDVVRRKQLHAFGKGKYINSMAFSPDGKTVAVGREGDVVTLWDVATLKEAHRLSSDPRGSRAVAFSPDGKTLATGEWGRLTLWDVAAGKKVRELEGTLFQVWDIAFSADNNTVAVGNLDSKVRLWDASTGKELPSVGGHREWINFLKFVDRDRGIASGSAEGLVRHWDLATAEAMRDIQAPGTQCYCGDLSPDGRTLALGDGEGVHIFEWATGKKFRLLKGHKLQLWSVAFSPKGDVLASAGNMDPNILLWDVASGKEMRRIPTPYQHGIRCLAWSPGGKVLACASATADVDEGKVVGLICLWDPATGRRLQKWPAHQGGDRFTAEVDALAFSPDGTLIASAGGDKTVGLWDATTGRSRARLLGHEKGVRALAFSPDGRTLASGSMDRTVRLWELATGKERRRFEGHLGGVSELVFSSDGLTLASASGDTSVLVWSVMGCDPPQPQADVALTPRQLEALWNDLASDDASQAWKAACTLAAAPKQSSAWIQAHLRPMSPADAKRIDGLIGNLDSGQFTSRQRAARELEKLGELAEPALRKTLKGQPSLEVCRCIEGLLAKLGEAIPTGERLRALRAVELLEQIGTPRARDVLQTLAMGTPQDRLTREANASLDRLARRPSDIP